MAFKGAITSLLVLAAATTFGVAHGQSEQDFEPKFIEMNEQGIPLSPEGIPVDMIGHYPSDGPTHAVRMPSVDPMNLELHSADEFKSAFEMQVASGEKFIAIFLGSKIPSTNNSWCPHCTQAMPQI